MGRNFLIKNIFNYIYIHPFTLFFILVGFLTGRFKEFIIFFIIIFIHELGHFLSACFFSWNVDKIYLYPYGGVSKFNNNYNKPIIEEFIILIMGPLIQLLFCLIIIKLNVFDNNLVRSSNLIILAFNLLPIYPLDGGKIVNLLFNKCFSYKKSSYLVSYLSIFNIILLIIVSFNYALGLNVILLLIFLLYKVLDEYFMIKYNYNYFLLDRYINKYKFNRLKFINNKNNFYRDKYHYINNNNRYIEENDFLEKMFKKR